MKFLPLFLLFPLLVFSQHPPPSYFILVSNADSLAREKKFTEAASLYNSAFELFNGKGFVNDRYKAACAYSMSGNVDSAYYNLFRIADKGGWSEYDFLVGDSDLEVLHGDGRWNRLVNTVRKNKAIAEARLNRPVATELEKIFDDDQKYRMLLDSAIKVNGENSPRVDSLRKTIRAKDAVNLDRVIRILDLYGWPGADEVGRKGNQALFLVIQHSNPKIRKKYLPSMRDAGGRNKVAPEELAALEDKVRMDEGKKQLYGTQLIFDATKGEYQFLPIEDEEHVNDRRNEMGLAPLEVFAIQWGIKYSPKSLKTNQK